MPSGVALVVDRDTAGLELFLAVIFNEPLALNFDDDLLKLIALDHFDR